MKTDSVRVLVVDDDDAKRYTVVRQLQRHGFSVDEAKDGAAGLKAAQKRPDLIVLDVKLPDIDGKEVCRRLKADPFTAPIPVLHLSSTFRNVEHRVEGLDSGADAYLVDITHPSELIATIRALVRARRAERALHESEQRFLLLVNSVREYAIFTCDADGRIASWNDGVERLLGLKRADFQDRSLADVLPEAGLAERVLDSARAAGNATWDAWQAKGDGSRIHVSGNVTSVRDESENLLGFTVILRDSTERMESEVAQRSLLAREHAARIEAERVNQAKDDFLATLSHELRTPLMSIVMWSEMMRLGGLSSEDVDEGVDSIHRSARSLTQLIEDLLDVSRVISGKMSILKERIELTSPLEAAADAVRSQAESKEVSLDLDLQEAKVPIDGDRVRLQQVFSNLLSNAIKFSETGSIVTVRSSRTHDRAIISVTDRGRGIDPEFLPKVFERFRQEDSSSTRLHSGLGLGLAIVQQLVDLHGGTVTAESEGRGRGATFIVALPIATSEIAGSLLSAESADATVSVPKPLSGVRVLLVEDDPDSRAALRQALLRNGADVATADSADAGLRAYLSHRPDVLVSDIGLPHEDGYSFLRRVREVEISLGRHVPAIALSAFAMPHDRQKASHADFQLHVPKPTKPVEIVEAILSVTNEIRERT